jgi:hypothetical protein
MGHAKHLPTMRKQFLLLPRITRTTRQRRHRMTTREEHEREQLEAAIRATLHYLNHGDEE